MKTIMLPGDSCLALHRDVGRVSSAEVRRCDMQTQHAFFDKARSVRAQSLRCRRQCDWYRSNLACLLSGCVRRDRDGQIRSRLHGRGRQDCRPRVIHCPAPFRRGDRACGPVVGYLSVGANRANSFTTRSYTARLNGMISSGRLPIGSQRQAMNSGLWPPGQAMSISLSSPVKRSAYHFCVCPRYFPSRPAPTISRGMS